MLRWYTERFRNHSGKSTQLWFRIQYGIRTMFPSFLRIISVQRHVSYSLSLCTKDGWSLWIQTITKFSIARSLYIYTINFLLISPWKTGAWRRSRPLLLALDFSELLSKATSNEGRLPDWLPTENSFFFQQQ